MQYMNDLHSSYQKDEKEKEMEKIKYKMGLIVGKSEMESEKIEIDVNRMREVSDEGSHFEVDSDSVCIETRAGAEFKGKAIYLPGHFDWVLCKDENGSICLVPLKKEIE